MKKRNFLYSLCLLVASTLFVSCDDGDTTKPVINLISPAEGAHLKIGNTSGVHFEAEFSDDEMLGSYKIDIHNNFDDHGHGTKSESEEKKTVDFEYSGNWDLSGYKNTTVHHHDIKIPENATPGKYHMVVYCLDKAGNESYVARNILLTNEDTDEEDHHDYDHE
ncbi:MAG: DUF4625 domain-containing protein [Tannerellaceae bacterium]|nr:DUF4625 domain-containing protein [Tannerellaceae bacterium]